MGELGERFMRAYNEIDGFTRSAVGADRRVRFVDVARSYAAAKNLPAAQLDLLRIFGDLRNALAHSEYRGSYPIAEPIHQIVDDIEQLRDKIKTPPKAIDQLEAREVCVAHLDEPLSKALEHVRGFDYSQLPVYDQGRYHGILTTNSIARWLARHIADNRASGDPLVRDILVDFSESTDRAILVDQSITVAQAIYKLNHGSPDRTPVNALIITEHGSITDHPLRVVVVYDLPILTAAM
jgi:predicted transcriptional regulator